MNMTPGTHHGRLTGLAVITFLLAFVAASYAETVNYIYDELNRLKRVECDGGAAAEYVYDGAGNRLQVQSPDIVAPTTTASPGGGLYNTSRTVTLACDDGSGSGCDRIYLTTNGATPTTASSVYSSPINISATTTLKYFAQDRVGNSETTKTQVYTIDTTPPTGAVSGPSYANNPDVTLTLTCNDLNGCSQMQFVNYPGMVYSTPEPYAAAKTWTLTTGDGGKLVYAKFRDAAGNWSGACSTGFIYLDTVPPTGSIAICSAATTTGTTRVCLELTCPDNSCMRMALSNDNVTYAPPEYFARSRIWTVPTGDGSKTIYVKFRDNAANWSPVYNATVLLDSTLPVTTASPAGGTFTTAQSVTLSCSDGAGSGCATIYYTTNGTTPTTASSVYSSPINISATTTLKFFAKDSAGNSEPVSTRTYTITGQ